MNDQKSVLFLHYLSIFWLRMTKLYPICMILLKFYFEKRNLFYLNKNLKPLLEPMLYFVMILGNYMFSCSYRTEHFYEKQKYANRGGKQMDGESV